MELLNVTKCYFVTGTDTRIGKTIASIALLKAVHRQGQISLGYKPVASGSKITPMGLRNSDALLLQYNSSLLLDYTLINPYAFFDPTSPHIVSLNERRPIEFSQLTQGLNNLKVKADFVVVEGVGGWFTPLKLTKTIADWVIQEKLPVILVVGIKIGCINHAMLTAQAITQAGLHLAGWIANNIVTPNKWHIEYISTLKHVLNAPFLGEIPWLKKMKKKDIKAWKYLNLNALQLSFLKN